MSLYAASVMGQKNDKNAGLIVKHDVVVVVASDHEHAKNEVLRVARESDAFKNFVHFDISVVLLSQT